MRQIILPVFLKFIIIWAFVSACSHFWQAFIISLMVNVLLFIHCPKRTMEVVNERCLLLYIPRKYSKRLLLNSITSTFWGSFHALRIMYDKLCKEYQILHSKWYYFMYIITTSLMQMSVSRTLFIQRRYHTKSVSVTLWLCSVFVLSRREIQPFWLFFLISCKLTFSIDFLMAKNHFPQYLQPF